jgi:hypothetical protein
MPDIVPSKTPHSQEPSTGEVLFSSLSGPTTRARRVEQAREIARGIMERVTQEVQQHSLAFNCPEMFGPDKSKPDLDSLLKMSKQSLASCGAGMFREALHRFLWELGAKIREIDSHTLSVISQHSATNQMSDLRPMPSCEFVTRSNFTLMRIVIPYLVAPTDDARHNYSKSIKKIIEEGIKRNVDCFVIDLRNNCGGNMWPMYEGLGALLGLKNCGGFFLPYRPKDESTRQNVLIDGQSYHWYCEPYHTKPTMKEATTTERIQTPIAVWVNGGTASSGEIISIILRGRPDTIIMGQQTAGMSTCNGSVAALRTATLFLTTGVCADRNGKAYVLDPLPLDRKVVGDETCLNPDDAWYDESCAWLKSR